MTLYELTQAIAKRKRPVGIATMAALLLALSLAFTIEDGSLSWRGGEKWEAGVQMAVVSQGNDSLVSAETRSEHIDAAGLYAGILQSNEAAAWIGEANGFELDEPVAAEVSGDSALINATLIGPSRAQAEEAALSIYEYLRAELNAPLDPSGINVTPTTPPTVELSGPFESALTTSLAPGLVEVDESLFLGIETGVGSSLVIPISRTSGSTVTIDTSLAPIMTLVLTLEDSSGTELDTVRLALPPVEGFIANYPELNLVIGEGAVTPSSDEDDEQSFQLDGAAVSANWEQGRPVGTGDELSTIAVDVVLITDSPAASQIGGRRGPILLGGVLVVAVILILTIVVFAETWSRERAALSVDADPGSNLRADGWRAGTRSENGSAGIGRDDANAREGSVFSDDADGDAASRWKRRMKLGTTESAHHSIRSVSDPDDT